MTQFREGPIEGVEIRELRFFSDPRGWLTEVFRKDDLDGALHPAMGYLSMTFPGVQRGPHAHADQADYFVFFSSSFRLFLWDSRAGSRTYMNRMALLFGQDHPAVVSIPPGVVHAYKNVGGGNGLILNLPNRLYAGEGKKGPVDEVRYEDDPGSIYRVD